jgi:hypothetical protein
MDRIEIFVLGPPTPHDPALLVVVECLDVADVADDSFKSTTLCTLAKIRRRHTFEFDNVLDRLSAQYFFKKSIQYLSAAISNSSAISFRFCTFP